MLLISIIAPTHLMLINCKVTAHCLQDDRKRRPCILEVGYIVTVSLVSLIAAAVPFLCLPFGVACYGYDPEGQWCWIRAKDENGVQIPLGRGMQIALFFTPSFIALFLILIVLCHIAIVIYQKGCSGFMLKLHPSEQDLKGYTCAMIALTCYLLLFSVCNAISFGVRINRIPIKSESIVLSINHSLWGFIPSVVVGFLLLFEWIGQRKHAGYEEIRSLST